MPQATREIKRRIRSIKNTRQITKAMELVSAAKMRRAVANVLSTRTYAGLGWNLLQDLSSRTGLSEHPLLQARDSIEKIGLVLITSNRGLCGAFNHQPAGQAIKYIVKVKQNTKTEVEVIAVGKRGRDIMARQGYVVTAEFIKPDITTKIEQILPIARLCIDDYLAGKYDRVVVVYTDYISALRQRAQVKQLLPLTMANEFMEKTLVQKGAEAPDYLFEPSVDEVLEDLLPRLLEVQVYQAMLESDASEHSARMIAMRNASDAAKDIIESLTLAFNQARQAAITTELADITGGRAALGV